METNLEQLCQNSIGHLPESSRQNKIYRILFIRGHKDVENNNKFLALYQYKHLHEIHLFKQGGR